MRKYLLSIAAIAVSMFTLASCSDEDTEKSAPTPPSVETIKPDFSALTTTKATSSQEFFSYVNNSILYTWNLIFNSVINVPLQGLEALANTAATYVGNEQWVWKVSVQDGGTTYMVYLYGKYESDDSVDWEVRVSSEGVLKIEDFCWLTGWSSADGKNGQWSVQAGPSKDTVLVTSSWTSDGEEVTDVKLEYKLDTLFGGILQNFNGSYIEFSKGASDSAYNATVITKFYQILVGWVNATVEWNTNTGAGRFMSSSNWGSSWHCWDGNKQDKD